MPLLNSGTATLGHLTLGDGPNSDSVADALETLLAQPWLARSWWVRAYPRDADTATDPPTTLTLNLSTDGHKTLPAETEHIQLKKTITQPYSVSMSISRGDLWGLVETTAGSVVIDRTQPGRHEFYLNEDWEGRQVDIYLGPKNGAYVEFSKVGKMKSRGIKLDNFSWSILLDPTHTLALQRNIQSTTYAGTGGLEGDESIKGKPKPLLLGTARRIEPVLVDGPNRIYQLHDGAFEALDGVVQDKGVDLVFDADYADITTATPAAGEYATSLATGYIRLGSRADGTVTVTKAKGHNTSSLGYVESLAGLIRLLATDASFGNLADPVDIDTVAFAALETAWTGAMGYWTGLDKISIADVMKKFLDSGAAYAWPRPDGILEVGRITNPDTATVTHTISQSGIMLKPWSVGYFERSVWKVRVGYRRYYRPVNASELAGSVTDANRNDYKEEYRYVEAPSIPDGKQTQTPTAREVVILTTLDNEADAQALAGEQYAMRSVIRREVKLGLRKGLLDIGIGDVLSVTDDRLPVSPDTFVVLGVKNEAGNVGHDDVIEVTGYG